jgi:ribosome maturation factor RimP
VGGCPLFLLVAEGIGMERGVLIRRVWQELEPHLEEQGYELVEVELGSLGHAAVLRVYVDRAGGVTLDDCAAMSELLSTVLDAGDWMTERYVLEVSSPGIDRPLRKPADFVRFVGEKVRVKTVAPIAGRRHFSGVLAGFRDGVVALECDGTVYDIHLENVLRANLAR